MEQNQLLRDPNVQPTPQVFAAALGGVYDTYTRFTQEAKAHGIEADWRYYNDGKAWLGKGLYKWTTARGTQKQMTAFWLSVWEGFFKVSIFIPEKAREEALALPLGAEARKTLEAAGQMGKMKIFPVIFDVATNAPFQDIFTLVEFKKTIQ